MCLGMSRISEDLQMTQTHQEGFSHGRGGMWFLAEPHDTHLRSFLDLKEHDLGSIRLKDKDQECSEGRFVAISKTAVLSRMCFEEQEGCVCFMVKRHEGWLWNILEERERPGVAGERGRSAQEFLTQRGTCTGPLAFPFFRPAFPQTPVSHLPASPLGLDSEVTFKMRLTLTIPTHRPSFFLF